MHESGQQARQQPRQQQPGSRPRHQAWSSQDTAFLIALVATALAMAAALAHVLELPAKMELDVADYFVAQMLYRGWDKLGILLAVELAGILAVIASTRSDKPTQQRAMLALAGLIAAQAIFWTWTFPANRATDNWTRVPDNWQELRMHWEYSHFAGAMCQGVAFVALVVAALTREPLPASSAREGSDRR